MNDILQDLSPSAVPQAMDANAIAFWTFFSRLPQVKLHNDPGIRWFETGIHHDVFNRAFQTRLETDAFPVEIDRASSYFQQSRLPFLWHVGPSSRPSNLGLLLQARGLIHYETEPGMAVDLLSINEHIPVASQLTIQPVTSEEQLQQWIRVWEFGSSEEVIRLWFTFYSGLHLNLQSPCVSTLEHLPGKQ